MTNEINWELYRSFLWVIQEGSLSAAARASGVTQPTIGRHIAALEKAFNRTLFIRSQGGLVPTREALVLRPHAEAMANSAAALSRAASVDEQQLKGVVRVTASDVIGVEVLPPVLAALRKDYPGVVVELTLSDRVHDLLLHEADIAVRMVRPQQLQLICRSAGCIGLGFYASHDYIARHGMPASEEELQQHSFIGYDQPTAFIRNTLKQFPQLEVPEFHLKTDSNVAQLAMIRAGAGIGICQTPLARQSRLVAILPEHFSMHMEAWITMHENLRQNQICRVVFDALAEGVGAYCRQGIVTE
ncbi:HTH-type transcriptional regulator CysL [Vibrio aerogenes CECT 7868]|uniref:HTH-type transcriptional regulator CysL n=1 Tax=Vibrio aerogenes CECT 7868 TaxID=1216006 RepID=A0A1M5ZSP0_9VIBR|nr:LysR family transcriptional regulator [Vibrio aerogenes]SHI27129.1 HTH-type transcriptional regulator CysL [Vibrio aerogenes CECT 7868]